MRSIGFTAIADGTFLPLTESQNPFAPTTSLQNSVGASSPVRLLRAGGGACDALGERVAQAAADWARRQAVSPEDASALSLDLEHVRLVQLVRLRPREQLLPVRVLRRGGADVPHYEVGSPGTWAMRFSVEKWPVTSEPLSPRSPLSVLTP